jgi:hypothetical protein
MIRRESPFFDGAAAPRVAFLPHTTGPLIGTHDFDELVRDLNQVVPYD